MFLATMVIFQPVKGRGPSNAVTHVLTDMSKPLAYHLYTAINDHKKGVWKGERKWTQKWSSPESQSFTTSLSTEGWGGWARTSLQLQETTHVSGP